MRSRPVTIMVALLVLGASALIPLLGAFASAGVSVPVGRGPGAIVEEAVLRSLAQRDRVPVLVLYDVPGAVGQAAVPMARRDDADAEAAILAAERSLLADLPADAFEVAWQPRGLAVLAGTASSRGVERLAADPRVRAVGLVPVLRPQLAHTVPFLGLDAPQALGFTGEGVTVAVLDSGIDTDHPDLADDLVEEQCFCSSDGGCCPAGTRRQQGPGSAEDDAGHGTMAAGLITSAGAVAPPGGAPDAGILAIKVTTTDARLDVWTSAIDVVEAGNWLRLERPDVDIVTMSLATGEVYAGPCDDTDLYTTVGAALVAELRAIGVLVVASAGNENSGTGMSLPACLSGVFSVGAVYDEPLGSQTFYGRTTHCTDETTAPDQVTCFSNSDVTTDLFATGADILAPAWGGGSWPAGGTSAAAPLVAACAALLREARPDATVDALEAALRSSSTLVTDAKNGLSFPRLDCAEALVALPEPSRGMLALASLGALAAGARARRMRRAAKRGARSRAPDSPSPPAPIPARADSRRASSQRV